jgi:tetratricopeptide (TPR) repeat protein
MTNRQSNIIFYSIISIIIYGLIINFYYPEFFDDFSKSKEQLSVEAAVSRGDNHKALLIYQQWVEKLINNNNEVSVKAAAIYEEMANLHFLLGNKIEEKNYYLKSLSIKTKLKKNDIFVLAKTYYKLGLIAEDEGQYSQAQMYYEKSLQARLGNTIKIEDEGIITGMHNSRLSYVRLNNEETIATFKKLGEIHAIKKEYSIAKKYYEKALAASKTTLGEDDAETLKIIKLISQLAS